MYHIHALPCQMRWVLKFNLHFSFPKKYFSRRFHISIIYFSHFSQTLFCFLSFFPLCIKGRSCVNKKVCNLNIHLLFFIPFQFILIIFFFIYIYKENNNLRYPIWSLLDKSFIFGAWGCRGMITRLLVAWHVRVSTKFIPNVLTLK